MPRRTGFSDSILDSKLAWVTGTTFPAAPGGLWLSLLSGIPGSDGSNVVELTPRVSVTYGSPASISGDGGYPQTRGIVPTADVSFTPSGSAAPNLSVSGAAFAVWSASSGGNPIYIGTLNWRLLVGVATTLKASELRITAAEAT
jgi:hypothetical protein